MNEKTIDSKGNPIARFSISNIEKLTNFVKENPENTQFIKELINATTIDDKGNTIARFSISNIEKLTNFANETPGNTQFIKDLINEKVIDYTGNTIVRFDASNIEKLIELYSDKTNQNLIDCLLNLKSQNENVLLFGKQIEEIIKINNSQPDLINKLISEPKYNIFLQGINKNNINFFENETVLNKIANQLNSDNYLFSLQHNYLDNSYQYEFSNGKDKEVFFVNKTDKGLEYNGSETQKTRGDKTLVRREFNDGSYLVEEIGNINVIINGLSASIPLSMKKTQFDNSGIQVRSEVLTPSKNKPGTYTINVYERGLNQSMVKKPIGTVELYGSKNQGMKAKRTVTSSDGTVTTHTIIQGPKGSGMKYEIKDKDGNILGITERQYRKIDENHYTSSVNGQKYDTQFVDDRVIVSKVDKNGNKTETIELGSDILDSQLKDLYKQLPGDYFFKIKEIGLKKVSINTDIQDNGAFIPNTNEINFSNELKNNSFVFAHELGHAIDFNYNSGKIHNNPELNNIYQEELAEYKKISSDAEGHSIDYFTTGLRPIPETIAEFNALTSGLINQDCDVIQLRSVVLQQHFPRTCAKIMELTQKDFSTTPKKVDDIPKLEDNNSPKIFAAINPTGTNIKNELRYISPEELAELKKNNPSSIKEMSNGDVLFIGEDFTFTKIGTTKKALGDSSVDLSNVSSDEARKIINNFIKNNKLTDIENGFVKNKLYELINGELNGKTKQHAMALLNVIKAMKDSNLENNISSNMIDFIKNDNYNKVIDYIKNNKNDFNTEKCITDIKTDIVKSNKSVTPLYEKAMGLAENPGMRNKFTDVIYNTINTTTNDKLISQIELMTKMNDSVLKTYLNSMDKTLPRVDGNLVEILNNIEPMVVEKLVNQCFELMGDVSVDDFGKLIKGFQNIPSEIVPYIDNNINSHIIESMLLGNKGIIDVFNKIQPDEFNKISEDVQKELSNKNHIYTDKEYIINTIKFIETPKFKEIKNTIKSKFPQIDNEKFDSKLKAFFIANKVENPDEFIRYIENLDTNHLIDIAPRIEKFEEEQLLEFLNYHQQRGTELTAENLTYNGNLTKDLQKDLVGYDQLSQILSRFPNTDRRIGHLPQEWMNEISKENQKDFAEKIYQTINSFVKSTRDNNSLNQFKNELQKLLGKNVEIIELTTGEYGTGYKITAENQKPFVLKAFNKPRKTFNGYNVHGKTIEPQNAMYAKGRSNGFAGFYFGQVADKFDNDGYMFVEFLAKKEGNPKIKDASITKLSSADFDAAKLHNFREGKIIDYGAMTIENKKLLEDKGIAKYTRIITSNIIASKNSDIYGFNNQRLAIVKNAVSKAENPMQVVEAINIIEQSVTKNIDENTINELKQIKKDAYIKYIQKTNPNIDANKAFEIYESNNI